MRGVEGPKPETQPQQRSMICVGGPICVTAALQER